MRLSPPAGDHLARPPSTARTRRWSAPTGRGPLPTAQEQTACPGQDLNDTVEHAVPMPGGRESAHKKCDATQGKHESKKEEGDFGTREDRRK